MTFHNVTDKYRRDEKIKELVSNSYDIVVKSLTKKEREML